MSHPWHHAENRARQWGGRPEDYHDIEAFFDQSKEFTPDGRHRLLLHQTFGIFVAERVFGPVRVNSAGRAVPTRLIGESHVKEDFGGSLPSLYECFHEGLSVPGETAQQEETRLRYLRAVALPLTEHLRRSEREFGAPPGVTRDLHAFLGRPADHLPGPAGLLVLHHTFGAALAVQVFGDTLPGGHDTRGLAEAHLLRDLATGTDQDPAEVLPAVDAALSLIPQRSWMTRRAMKLSRLHEEHPGPVTVQDRSLDARPDRRFLP